MNLTNGSTVGGYPIIHEGNLTNIVSKDGNPENFITVSQADNKFIRIFDSLSSDADDGDFAIFGNPPHAYIKVNGVWNEMILKIHGGLVTVGTVISYAGATVPSGFLECNGAAVSRTTYSSLFSIIGTTYGAGNGSTTFNLPDFRGEFIRARDNGRGMDSVRGLGNFQSDEIKSHNHTGTTSTSGNHRHGVPNDISQTYTSSGNKEGWRTPVEGIRIYSTTAGEHVHTVTLSNSGSNETRPKNIALMQCIKF